MLISFIKTKKERNVIFLLYQFHGVPLNHDIFFKLKSSRNSPKISGKFYRTSTRVLSFKMFHIKFCRFKSKSA